MYVVRGGAGLGALRGLGPLSPCHPNLATVSSNRITGCPVDIPNSSLWLRAAVGYNPTAGVSCPAGAAQPHLHLPALGTPGNWGEGSKVPPKAIFLHQAPAAVQAKSRLDASPALSPRRSSTTRSLGVLFSPVRRVGESWTHSSFIMTPREPRTAPPT